VFAVAAPHEGQSYVEVVVGVLSAISLLLLLVFVVIVVLSKRHKLQGSPTTILRNSFGATINMKVCATHYLGFSLAGNDEG
jgi:discoidin domain receptor family member 2